MLFYAIEIGLYLFEFDGIPFLKIGGIIDFFQIFGILPENKDELKIIYKGLHNSLEINVNIEDGIPSVPKVCVIFSLFKYLNYFCNRIILNISVNNKLK